MSNAATSDTYDLDGPWAKPPAMHEGLTDEEVLAMWRRGELVVRTGRIHHGNLCVCPEKGDGEWCDKCEGYALEQGQ